MSDVLKIVPVGVAREVELRVLEDRRPGCCPDPKGCRPIHTTHELRDALALGYSGSCYGYCGERVFVYGEAEHRNDISRCVMTPLKGVVRFFECYTDFLAGVGEMLRVANILNPFSCAECGVSRIRQQLSNYFDPQDPCDDAKRRWLCLGCAVRLGVVEYRPEKKVYSSW